MTFEEAGLVLFAFVFLSVIGGLLLGGAMVWYTNRK